MAEERALSSRERRDWDLFTTTMSDIRDFVLPKSAIDVNIQAIENTITANSAHFPPLDAQGAIAVHQSIQEKFWGSASDSTSSAWYLPSAALGIGIPQTITVFNSYRRLFQLIQAKRRQSPRGCNGVFINGTPGIGTFGCLIVACYV